LAAIACAIDGWAVAGGGTISSPLAGFSGGGTGGTADVVELLRENNPMAVARP
jgi:hypothetical protein